MSRVPRRICFTINNFEEYPPRRPANCTYMICQQEQGERGTPHIQGYLELKNAISINSLKAICDDWRKAHIEPARGTWEQSRDYCTKEDTRIPGTRPYEFGEAQPSAGAGKRTDIDRVYAFIKEGNHDLQEVIDYSPTVYFRCQRVVEQLVQQHYKPPPALDLDQVWRPWQSALLAVLDAPPHPRHIHFYVDPVGNSGKSFICRWLSIHRSAFLVGPSKHDRIYYTYSGQAIVLFDYPRSTTGEHSLIPYSVIESLKNGYVPPGMYGRPPRHYPSPHILVFTNNDVDLTQFSRDRYVIHHVTTALPAY